MSALFLATTIFSANWEIVSYKRVEKDLVHPCESPRPTVVILADANRESAGIRWLIIWA